MGVGLVCGGVYFLDGRGSFSGTTVRGSLSGTTVLSGLQQSLRDYSF
jgi:hypothetical protein